MIIQWVELLVSIIVAILGSQAFSYWIQHRNDKKDAKTQMLIGLGHDRITYLGMKYLDRGDWILEDEYENLIDYLYKPYRALGGNGSAEKIVEDCKKLRILRAQPEGDA